MSSIFKLSQRTAGRSTDRLQGAQGGRCLPIHGQARHGQRLLLGTAGQALGLPSEGCTE